MKKILCILTAALLLLQLTACSAAGTPDPTPSPAPTVTPEPTATPEPTPEIPLLGIDAGIYFKTYESAETGNYLDYLLMVPENATEDLPLVVFLHGDGYVGRFENLTESGIIRHVQEIYGNNFPFLLLMPNTREYSWEDGTIPATLLGLIGAIQYFYSTDTSRTILTGHSRGAIGTWYLISTRPDFFSCAVPVSCCNDMSLRMDLAAQVPVWAFVGSGESDYGNYGHMMQYLVDCIVQYGGTAQLTVLDGLEHGETEYAAYTQEVFDWMLAQQKSAG